MQVSLGSEHDTEALQDRGLHPDLRRSAMECAPDSLVDLLIEAKLRENVLEAVRMPQGSFPMTGQEFSWSSRGLAIPWNLKSREGVKGVERWLPISVYGKTVAQAQRDGDKLGSHFPDSHYHVIRRIHLDDALKRGLTPQYKTSSDYGRGFVFLHSNEKAARLHFRQVSGNRPEDWAIVRVDSKGLDPELMVTDHAYGFGLAKNPPNWSMSAHTHSYDDRVRNHIARMRASGGPFSLGARAHWGRIGPEHLSVHPDPGALRREKK